MKSRLTQANGKEKNLSHCADGVQSKEKEYPENEMESLELKACTLAASERACGRCVIFIFCLPAVYTSTTDLSQEVV